jgi:hypothetical protein
MSLKIFSPKNGVIFSKILKIKFGFEEKRQFFRRK